MKKLLVITSYPDKKGEGAKQNAIACYSQNLLSAYKDREIIVLSDIISNRKAYRKDNLLIVPCWKAGSPFLFGQILGALAKFSNIKDVLIQFEFNMLGSVILTSLFPLFIGILRLLGKNVTLVQHQVVGDLSNLSGHLNVKPHSLKNFILNSGLSLFYFVSGIFANSVIVHEEVLKQRLSGWVDKNKIVVIPHGLSRENASKTESKEFTLLLFGYLSWYKGVDWLIKKVGDIKRKHPSLKIKLIVAGGPSATLKSKPHYQKFLQEVEKLAKREKATTDMVGYVPEKDVRKYFSISDVVVLPYRTLMGASGPLSFALRFGKPFMVSHAFSSAFEDSGIKEDFTFSLDGDDFEEKLLKVYRDRKLYLKIKQLSVELGNQRTWENIVLRYEEAINRASVSTKPAIKLATASS